MCTFTEQYCICVLLLRTSSTADDRLKFDDISDGGGRGRLAEEKLRVRKLRGLLKQPASVCWEPREFDHRDVLMILSRSPASPERQTDSGGREGRMISETEAGGEGRKGRKGRREGGEK